MDLEPGIPVPDHPTFVWIDRNPQWPGDPAERKTVMSHVAVEVKKAGGWVQLEINSVPETDEGANFVTTVVASFRSKTRWLTIWMPPGCVEGNPLLRSTELRFVVQGTSGTFHSPAFTLASARARGGLIGIARKPETPE